MDFSKLTQSDKILIGAGGALIISLLLLPWHSFSSGGFSFTRRAVQSPGSGYGWLALLLTLVIAGTLIAEKATAAKLPELPVSWIDARFYGSAATIAILLLKYITETDFIGFGAYLAIVLAAGMTYGAFVPWQEARANGDGTETSDSTSEDSGTTEG